MTGIRQNIINLTLLLAFASLQVLQLFVLPIWLLPESPSWGYLLLLPILMTNPWWAFIHEAIHGCMFANKNLNRLCGRINAVLFGSPFDLLRWGHLLHHAYSRTERERTEVYTDHVTSIFWFRFNYYFRLLGGLYLFEVLGGILLLLPRRLMQWAISKIQSPENVVEQMYRKVMEDRTLTAARVDVILILTVYGLSFSLYGQHAWMLLAAIVARGCLISVVDNVFHYETPLEHTRYARNLYLPDGLSRFILHFNLHGVHHLNPSAPWWQLPQLHQAADHGYQGHWMNAIQTQFKGPIAIEQMVTMPDRSHSTR